MTANSSTPPLPSERMPDLLTPFTVLVSNIPGLRLIERLARMAWDADRTSGDEDIARAASGWLVKAQIAGETADAIERMKSLPEQLASLSTLRAQAMEEERQLQSARLGSVYNEGVIREMRPVVEAALAFTQNPHDPSEPPSSGALKRATDAYLASYQSAPETAPPAPVEARHE